MHILKFTTGHLWNALLLCVLPVILLYFSIAAPVFAQPTNKEDNDIRITLTEPDKRGGKAYRMIYVVDVPMEIYWKFKTDFDNDFLVKNKYIEKHRFIGWKNGRAITENEYTIGPDCASRWATRVFPNLYRLEFELINPDECRQEFHYGSIELKSLGRQTKIIQKAYFDFFGATFWVFYPFSGGMKSFFRYTARWEQKIVVKLKSRYISDSGP